MGTVLQIVTDSQLYPNHKVGLGEGVEIARNTVEGEYDFSTFGIGTFPIFMTEDMARYSRFRFHIHNLLFSLSTMRSHRDFLHGRHDVYYYPIEDHRSFFEKLRDAVHLAGADALATYEPEDPRIETKLKTYAKELGLPILFRPSKNFLLTGEEIRKAPGKPDQQDFLHFYMFQRRRMKILLDGSRPLKDQWTFPHPPGPFQEDVHFLPLPGAQWSHHTEELAALVPRLFPDNVGDPADFFLPTTRVQSLKWMDAFLLYRLPRFAAYENSIHRREPQGFHSLLSPLLNAGMILPGEVVEETLRRDLPIHRKEPFLRRIIGTREFVRGSYREGNLPGGASRAKVEGALESHGQSPGMGLSGHRRKPGKAWYTGDTGIPILDDTIRKARRYAYVPHIERRMILANLMVLSELAPDEIYRWFSEFFVDAREWAIIPNVYGIACSKDSERGGADMQWADSATLLRISNYPPGPWCDTVDGLYLRFFKQHRSFFEAHRLEKLLGAAEKFIAETTVFSSQ